MRETICSCSLSQNRNFHSRALWSDETWWVLDPESSSQNDRIWARCNHRDYKETRYQGKSKTMGWVGLLQGKIIGPFWCRDENRRPITVNLVVYLNMLRNQVCPLVEHWRDIRRLWFNKTAQNAIQPLQYNSFYRLLLVTALSVVIPNSLARSKPRPLSPRLLFLGLWLCCNSSLKSQEHCRTAHKHWKFMLWDHTGSDFSCYTLNSQAKDQMSTKWRETFLTSLEMNNFLLYIKCP